MLRRTLSFLCLLLCLTSIVVAQSRRDTVLVVDIPAELYGQDSILLPEVLVTQKHRPRRLSAEERQAYWRRIRDVKKTLPYAKYIAQTIIETYEYTESLPSEEERKAHWKRVERELKAEMEPKMRKLTLRQGKLLMQLVERQTGQTSYDLLRTFIGGWRAWWWNGFAKLLGANLKTPYLPEEVENDVVTERIVRLVELGLI